MNPRYFLVLALGLLGAIPFAQADDASIRATLAAVSRHQLRPLQDGDYAPVASAEALQAAREPEGIAWSYPWGVTLYGALRSTDFTGDREVEHFVLEHNRIAARDYAFVAAERAKLGAEGLKGYKSKVNGLVNLGSLDSCGAMGAQMLEGILRHPEQETPEEKIAVARIADWILHRQDRLPDGTLWRSQSDGRPSPADWIPGTVTWKKGTIWLDDLYMACPFLVRWSQYTGDPGPLDDAARQIINMAGRLQDADGVWYHAYFINEQKHSPFKWGRANGWGVVAAVEVLSAMPASDPLRPQLLDILRRQLEGIRRLQAPSGLWHQVLDHPEIWEETSCSAMFAYGYARAVNRGWIDPSNLEVARRAFAGLQARITPEGVVKGTCAGTNVGLVLSYYVNRPRPDDDLHGRGVVLLAGSELLAADRPPETVRLSSVVHVRDADNEHARPALDRNAQNGPLLLAGREFARGVGAQADTRIAVELGGATRFTATAGVDDATESDAVVIFEALADGQSLWRAELKKGEAPVAVDLDLRGRQTLVLSAVDTGNVESEALADWADAQFAVSGERPKSAQPASLAEAKVVLTPPAPATPRINGARVFGVRPGHPFLFQIPATGERPMSFAADGLPAGLELDAATGHITGVIASPGTHLVTLRATNAEGRDASPLKIVVGETVALTPPMGWNSWNSWATAVDQDKVLASGRAMSASGLIQHGWSYVNIDDTWQGVRSGPDHALQPNEKFPDIKALADQIHGLGLKLGIYSTPWVTSYAGHAGGSAENPEGVWQKPEGPKQVNRKALPWAIGKYSFAAVDARQWAEWGIDYLKYDWSPIEAPETAEMAHALRDSGRDLILSLSNNAPFAGAADWARLANAWRTTGDIRDSWASLHGIGFSQGKWQPFAGPGHWNDPDMLVVGNVGWGPKLHASHLTPNEQYTHISLWCLLSAPLLIGCPIEQMDAFTLSLLTNDEVLALDQDELGHEAAQAVVDGRRQVWVKELADGSHAIGLFNLAQSAQEITVTWAQLGLTAPARVRDLWRQQDLGAPAEKITATVPRHGVALIRVWPLSQK